MLYCKILQVGCLPDIESDRNIHLEVLEILRGFIFPKLKVEEEDHLNLFRYFIISFSVISGEMHCF